MAKPTEVVAGINAVKARLRRGDGLLRLVLCEGKASRRIEEIEALARERRCVVERRPRDWFEGMTPVAHQGVVLLVVGGDIRSEAFLDELMARSAGNRLLLVLDGITDPRNFGACVRSAAVFGVDAVVVPRDNSAPLNEAAMKTASGGASIVPVVQVANLSRCLTRLRKANLWIVGTLLDAEQAIHEVDLSGNVAIVVGSEDRGLRKNTVDHCDFLVRIPMVNGDLGFNVSVAAGICLYEARRQRDRA